MGTLAKRFVPTQLARCYHRGVCVTGPKQRLGQLLPRQMTELTEPCDRGVCPFVIAEFLKWWARPYCKCSGDL